MQRLEVSGVVRLVYGSLGVKRLRALHIRGRACWDTCKAVTCGTRRHVIAAWTPRHVCLSTDVGGNTGHIL